MEQRSHKALLQNIAIALLSVSAVALFAQTQLSPLDSSQFSAFFASRSSEVQAVQTLTDLSAPVHVAVTGTYGRYGDLTMTTGSTEFSSLGTLLGEALGSAGTPAVCTLADFLAALGENSVYYDFTSPLPMEVLAGLTGASRPGDSLSVRSLLLAAGGNGVDLYLWDGGTTYSRTDTALPRTDLLSQVNHYQLGNAAFASDPEEGYSELAPLTLLVNDLPSLPEAAAVPALPGEDVLLTSLDFNPHTNSRYTEADGTEVVVDGGRTLRIRADGTVLYQDNTDASLTVSAAKDGAPTETEAVIGTHRLAALLLDEPLGDAGLYLQEVRQEGNETVVRYGCQLNGVPVRNGSSAAEITLSGSAVVSMQLLFRQYTLTAADSHLLPLTQAAAIAASYPGTELTLGYAEDGGALRACWLAD